MHKGFNSIFGFSWNCDGNGVQPAKEVGLEMSNGSSQSNIVALQVCGLGMKAHVVWVLISSGAYELKR